jgi:hypothetical protein
MSKSIFVAAGLAAAATVLLSQETSAPNVPVQVIVTVEARHGKDVPSLNLGDVMAYQRHQRLQVTDVVPLRGDHAGLELFVLLDEASGSSLGTQLGDLRQFIQAQPATTAIAIGYMRNGTVDIVQNFITDHSHAAQTLRLPLSSFGAMASPYLSLTDVIKRWPGNSTRREVLMVTSGVDPLGGTGPMNPYLDTAIEQAQRNGIIVYAIYSPGVGHSGHSFYRMNWGQNHLAQLGEETGGETYMLGFGAPVAFEPYLTDVAERLTQQYRVTILVKPGNKAGFQDVRFATEVPNAELVSANRVYVPGSH